MFSSEWQENLGQFLHHKLPYSEYGDVWFLIPLTTFLGLIKLENHDDKQNNDSVDWKDDDGDRGCCEIQQRFPSLGLRSLSSSGSNHTFVNKLTKLGRCDRETIELTNNSNDKFDNVSIVRTAGRANK